MANPSQILGQNDPPAVPASEAAVIGFESTASGPALLVSIAGGAFVVNVNLDLADDEVAIGGPDAGDVRRLFRGRDDGGGRNVLENVPVLLGAQALALGKAEDSVAADGDVGVMSLAVRNDAGTALAADGDYIPLMVDASGNLFANVRNVTPGTGATNLGKAEDAAHSNGDVGIAALAVRQDTPGTLVGTNGDYANIQLDANGQLRVGGAGPTALGKVENAVAAANDVGVPALAVRSDSPASGVAPGDYGRMQLDGNSRLHTRALTGGGTSATTSVIAVAGASTSLVVGPANSMACATIQNRGPGPLYIHVGAGPAVNTDFVLSPGESEKFFCSPGAGIFGISNAAGASAVVIVENP